METARLLAHWQDEGDAVFLYRNLSEAEEDPKRRSFFREMAEIEIQHQSILLQLLEKGGMSPPGFSPSWRVRLLLQYGKLCGTQTLLPLLIRSEAREMRNYLQESILSEGGRSQVMSQIARESGEHARQLMDFGGQTEEPWHRVRSGGFLRSVVYGFNDGLTANFGLVMGVIGAQVDHHIVLVSGLAGMLADALSMGSSGYLAAKSENEVYANEIRMDSESAHSRAETVMQDKTRSLEEKVRLELGLSLDPGMTPLKEGGITGVATAFGALIPIVPFIFSRGTVAVATSFVICMFSHFLVGAGRSVFTGRGLIRSGFDMFLVGLGVALIGYYFGEILVGLFA